MRVPYNPAAKALANQTQLDGCICASSVAGKLEGFLRASLCYGKSEYEQKGQHLKEHANADVFHQNAFFGVQAASDKNRH